MANFKEAYFKTKSTEGGYANVEGDTGGETYAGVSRKWFPNWKGWHIVDAHKPLKHNQIIKDETLETYLEYFYKEEFWDKINGDTIPLQKMAEAEYDMAINASVKTAKNLLK
jgi:lysozyme family protein